MESSKYMEQLHQELKQFFNKKTKKADIPLYIEKTFDWRREQIQSNVKPFLELFSEYKYLIDLKNVSKFF